MFNEEYGNCPSVVVAINILRTTAFDNRSLGLKVFESTGRHYGHCTSDTWELVFQTFFYSIHNKSSVAGHICVALLFEGLC